MTEQNLDIVVGERSVVVEDLVEGVAESPCVGLAQAAALIRSVAVVLVVGDGTLVVIEVGSQIDGQPKAVKESVLSRGAECEIRPCRQCVAVVVGLVVVELGPGVESLGGRTVGVAVVVLVTIFILKVSSLVEDVVSGHVLQVDRVDRCHELGGVPDVGCRGAGEVLVVGLRVRVVRAHPDLHPGIGLGVHVDSSGVAVEVRVL